MTKPVTISGITCYGKIDEDSGVIMAGHCKETGAPFEEFADHGGCTTWREAVKQIKAWADKHGIVIEELQAD